MTSIPRLLVSQPVIENDLGLLYQVRSQENRPLKKGEMGGKMYLLFPFLLFNK